MKVTWVGSPNYTPGRAGHNPQWTKADPNTWIVDHTTVGTLAAALARFRSATGGASSTYVVDVNGTIYQCVRETDAPWTNGTMSGYGSNLDSITIEHVDNGNYNGPRDPRQIEASAQLHADISRRRGIPLIHRKAGGGVIGHRECTNASTACPDALPIDRIIARANQILHPPAPAPAPVPVPAPAPPPAPIPPAPPVPPIPDPGPVPAPPPPVPPAPVPAPQGETFMDWLKRILHIA